MRRFTLFLLSLVIWVLLTWPYDFATGQMDWQFFVLGVFAAGLVSLLFVSIFTKSPHKLFILKRYLWLLYYLPIFFYYCVKANLDVVYRVLHPRMPINPGIVKVRTKLKSESGITALCNSITLTPGTVSRDVAGREITVHALSAEGVEELQSGRMDRRASRLVGFEE